MKRFSLLLAILLMAVSLPAQAQEREKADSTTVVEKVSGAIGKQLGHNYFDPPNHLFFRQAVRELGFFPAVLATLDRIQRASRLGTMDAKSLPVKEGPEAYGKRRRKR